MCPKGEVTVDGEGAERARASPAIATVPSGTAAAPVRTSVGVRLAAVLFAATVAGMVAGRAAGWVPFSWLEILGAATGTACVLLVVARSTWNFPVGIVSCIAYLIFFADGRLYADAGLQVVFILLALHGWVAWARGRAETSSIRRVPVSERLPWPSRSRPCGSD